jgi:hypothetical protein
MYVARGLDLPVGRQWIVSNNLHIYTENPVAKKVLDHLGAMDDVREYTDGGFILHDPYTTNGIEPLPLVDDLYIFDKDIQRFLKDVRENLPLANYHSRYIMGTAVPLVMAHREYKDKQMRTAIKLAGLIEAPDWRLACMNWLNRKL